MSVTVTVTLLIWQYLIEACAAAEYNQNICITGEAHCYC